MKKQKLAILLIITTVLSMFTFPAHAISYEYFPDVPDDAPYAYAVNVLAGSGIFAGDDRGNFNPDKTITRAEFATIVCRLLGVEDEAKAIKTSSFNDVSSSHWACGYITKAAELGLVNGYGNGRFGPADTLTYEQTVTILLRAWGYENAAVIAGGYPKGYLAIADEIGIISNTPSTNTKENINRSVVAVLTYNTLLVQPSVSNSSSESSQNDTNGDYFVEPDSDMTERDFENNDE